MPHARHVNAATTLKLRNWLAICLAILGTVSGGAILRAQGTEGGIMGALTDQSGAVLLGATVTVIDVQRGISRSLQTDNAGEYSAPHLTPGVYKVRAEAPGFQVTERQNIQLEVGSEIRVDLVLHAGNQIQTILVVDAPPLTETTNVTVGGSLDNQTINDLPLNGRNFESLEGLRPGVTVYPGGGSWTQSTDGLRPHDNVFFVDGINSNDPWLGMSVMNSALLAGDAGTLLPLDSIDEFKTEVNPPAEYGWRPGAVVNVGLKSGTNGLHGTAYAYGRSDAFDARDYFNPSSGPSAAPHVPLELEQFGASAGGRIIKDRLFYFANFEEQTYTVGSPANHTLAITGGSNASDPVNGLQGACASALAPGGGGVTALSAQFAGLSQSCTPLTNYPGLFPSNATAATGVNSSLNSQSTIQAGLTKVDYHINDKHDLHGSYFISPGAGTVVDDPPHQVFNQQLSDQYARAQVLSGSWTWALSSKLINEARGGYSHYYQRYRTADSNDNPASYSFQGSTYSINTGQTNPNYYGLPELRFTSLPNFQIGAGSFQNVGPDGILHFLDHVSYLRGKHSLKFGGEMIATKNDVIFPNASVKGSVRFSNLQTFFNGVPNKASFVGGDLQRNLTTQGYAGFVQDEWRIRPKVTINLGLRYETNTVLKDSRNLLGNFDPNLGLVQVGKQISSPYDGHHHNFSPRAGVAWDVLGNGKTVVRAGGNLTYEQLTNDIFGGLQTIPTGAPLFANGASVTATGTINALANSYRGSELSGNAPGDLAYGWANNGASTSLFSNVAACGDGSVQYPANTGVYPGPCSIQGVDPHLAAPYVTTWTIGIQQALSKSVALEVAYVGNHGSNLISLTDLNQPAIGTGWTAAATATCLAPAALYQNCSPDSSAEQASRPYNPKFPYLSYINLLKNLDRSNYNALQSTLTARNAHGLNMTAGYTYSHALDNNSDNWGVIKVPIGPNLRYASSDFDIRQRLTVSTNYHLPGKPGYGQMLEGWSLNSVTTLQGGLPWFVQDTSNDFSGTGEIGNPKSEYENWVLVGTPNDFTMKHGFTSYNGGVLTGGTGGVPFFQPGYPGSIGSNYAINNTACMNAASAQGPLGIAALTNSGCFALGKSVLVPAAYGTLGSTSRNNFRDSGYKNIDFSVAKDVKFRELLTAQLRVEFFNVLNHPAFANPYGGPSGGAADNDPSIGAGFGCGCVTADEGGQNPVLGSGGPRAMQLGMKLIW
jgi:hypothetical protein